MATNAVCRPGVLYGRYPQKKEAVPDALEQWVVGTLNHIPRILDSRKYQLRYIVSRVNRHTDALKRLSESELTAAVSKLRQNLIRFGLKEKYVVWSFAIIRELSGRVLEKRHFDVQLLGGWIMMNGMVAEMETGQGKTLTATLASCTTALARIPVHVITTNDYLASRDAEILRPLYERLGLTVGTVVDGMESEIRRNNYACDIVHTTNTQLAFDYLRDRMQIGNDVGHLSFQFRQIQGQQQASSEPLLLRGLCFAIVDEADSVLIDEARTPLIISKSNPNAEQNETYKQALSLAEALNDGEDYIINLRERDVSLTVQGESYLTEMSKSLPGLWAGRRRRRVMIKQALTAQYFFQRDKQYIVRDGKVQIVDENTGRVMADRSWEQGLHQLIEVKEGCEITGEREPLARITYQRFFRRYLRLAGMSGTLNEVADELRSVYRLRVVKVPTHRPTRRNILPERLYTSAEAKWKALVYRIKTLNQIGRSILIGTCTVEESEYVSELLAQAGLSCQVLNARQDENEAEIISQAGELGCITVATNMAGRGTDIQLAAEVEQLGGLHVIATQRNDSRRVDRQLYGRCARQGDPGSIEAFLSIEDRNIAVYYPRAMLKKLTSFGWRDKPVPKLLGDLILMLPQKHMERDHRRIRSRMLKMDEQIAKTLAFTGRLE